MSDRLIDAIREVDPCPDELSAPPIDLMRRRLRDEPADAGPAVAPRHTSVTALAVAVPSAVAIAVAVWAIVVLGHARHGGRTAGPGGSGVALIACRSQVRDRVLPRWARAGFTEARPRMHYAIGQSGRIAAILWTPLDSPSAATHTNKILWVSRVAARAGGRFTIQAQRMVGATRVGEPVKRTVPAGPGPSIINLPSPGCWRMTLHWSGWTDHIDLRYRTPG
jgi:hypothetical protein